MRCTMIDWNLRFIDLDHELFDWDIKIDWTIFILIK